MPLRLATAAWILLALLPAVSRAQAPRTTVAVKLPERALLRVSLRAERPGNVCAERPVLKGGVAHEITCNPGPTQRGELVVSLTGGAGSACRHEVAGHLLVGPLEAGRWRVRARVPGEVPSVSVVRFREVPISTTHDRAHFSLPAEELVRVTLHAFGKPWRRCRNEAPVRSQRQGRVVMVWLEKPTGTPTGGLCRALPSVRGSTTLRLGPGRWEIRAVDASVAVTRLVPLP